MALVNSSNVPMALTYAGLGRHYLIKNTIDASESVASGGVGTLLTTDTHKVLLIKEGWLVNRVWIRLVEKGTLGATTISALGDSGTANIWSAANGINGMAIGTGGTVGNIEGGTLNGLLYDADDYIVMTLAAAHFDGIIEVAAEIIDVFGLDSITT